MRFAQIFLVFAAACAVAPVAAQDAGPTRPTPTVQSTTTPAPNPRYQSKPGPFNACKARVAEAAGKPCDVIFIGDSITDRWLGPGKEIWQQRYAPRHALNFGCFADQTQNVLWRMDHLDIAALKPKVAVLLIGTNNSNDTPEAIASGVNAIIRRTQGLFPGIKTILVSIMPNQRAQEVMMTTNAIIKGFANDQSIFWLDLDPLMAPVTTATPDGTIDHNWQGLGSDHLHPDVTGYRLWSDAMEPLMTRLLAEGANQAK